MLSVAEANRIRWAHQPGHREAWYATLTHPETRTGFWFRYTFEAPKEGHGAPYAQLWFARFCGEDPQKTFGINRKFAIGELRAEHEPFRVRIGEAELRSDGMRGALSGSGHTTEWEMSWRPSETVHLHMPDAFYHGHLVPSKLLAPNLNVAARGHVTVDGERYELDGAPLGQAHQWGQKLSYSWAWSHCNAFEGDRGAVLETLSGRMRRGPIVLPKMSVLALYLEGDEPARLEFRQPWKMPFVRAEYATGRYHLLAADAEHKVEAELTCRPEDMIMAEYVDPDGEAAYCHNTECADARVKVWRRSPFVGRFREHRTLVSSRGAHYEWGARAGDPLVKKRHVTIE